ncbi:hypothetical protein HYW83_01105 [Candidatus Peregrinibacteria bacterium]|nr:hypothetical protein [Candidatus Peregrinibacteria bacterium]
MGKTNNGVKFSLFAVTLLLLSAAVVPALAQFGGGGFEGGFSGGLQGGSGFGPQMGPPMGGGFGPPMDMGGFDMQGGPGFGPQMGPPPGGDFGPPMGGFGGGDPFGGGGGGAGVRGGVRGGMQGGQQNQQKMMRGAPQMGPPPMIGPMGDPGFGNRPKGNPFSNIRVNVNNISGSLDIMENMCDISGIECSELDGIADFLDDYEEAAEAACSEYEDSYLDPSDPADRAELRSLKKVCTAARSSLKKAQRDLAKKVKSLLPVFKQRFKEVMQTEAAQEKASREEHLKEREDRLKAIKEDDAMRQRESEIRMREYQQSVQPQPSISPAPSVDAASQIPMQ